MTHVSFRERGEPPYEADVDYVVIGSGAGGAAAASTLSRAGASVAIVEAGAWRDPDQYPHSTYGSFRDLMDDWGATLAMDRAIWPIVQARCMGGTTVINSAICVRTPADVFDRWQREAGIGGTAGGRGALRDRVWAHQDVLEKELSVEEVPVAARGRSNELAFLGGQKAGFPDSHYMRRYVKGCIGSGQCLQGCRALKKQSTNITLVPEVEKKGLVLSSAPVEKIVIDGRRATGVRGHFVHPRTRARGATFLVRAKKAVLVAASVTHTPCILMASGVKSRALGQGFRAHPGTGVFGCYADPVDQNIGATQGWASTGFREHPGLKLETLAIPLELVASRFSGGGVELMKKITEYRHVAMWCHAVRAESVGSVSRNWLTGKPQVRYGLDKADMLKFREGMYLLAKQHVAAGCKELITGIAGMPYKMQPNEIEKLKDAPLDPRAYIAILSHLFGGAVMGTDPNKSVTDGRGRVHGYEGLVVCDASVIPSNLGVNPQHTIMGLARTFAEDLLEA
jgi:choline dehydrogenase-like flavoprotein